MPSTMGPDETDAARKQSPKQTDHPTSSQNSEVPWAGPQVDTPTLLSTLWIAVLFADVLRGVHETLRPGFVDELAHQGTNYGRQTTDGILFWSGLVLVFITSVVVLARILPRRWNRRVNVMAAVLMAVGVLASWPKDPDDFVFGTFQLIGAALVVVICARWRDDTGSVPNARPALGADRVSGTTWG